MKVRPIDPVTRNNLVMALPRASLNSFLATAKATLNTAAQHAQPITFVVGNESAGRDPVTLSITPYDRRPPYLVTPCAFTCYELV